jgi:hypothetical protein
MISDRGIAAPDQDHAHKMLTLDSIAAVQAVFPSVGTGRHAGDLPQIVVIVAAMTPDPAGAR